MRKAIEKWFLVILFGMVFILSPQVFFASPVNDTVPVQWRKFDEKQIERFRKDPSYYYEKERTATASWWEEFKNWLKKLFWFDDIKNENSDINSRAWDFIYYFFIIAAAGVIIWGLTRASFRGFITGKGKRVQLDYEVAEEDIHAIEYETELQIAEREKDFRKAVRLRYLEILKILTDKGWIVWEPNKTNHEYQAELRNTIYLEGFQKLTLVFDYVWYGEFEIDQAAYTPFAEDFKRFAALAQKQPSNPNRVVNNSLKPTLA